LLGLIGHNGARKSTLLRVGNAGFTDRAPKSIESLIDRSYIMILTHNRTDVRQCDFLDQRRLIIYGPVSEIPELYREYVDTAVEVPTAALELLPIR
jgi:ABC-type polysaccharide/polyol phosphate transport system ATPase subunit